MNILREMDNYEIEDKEKDAVLSMIFGQNGNRDDCLISSKNKEEYNQGINVLLEQFENYPHKSSDKTFRDGT